MHNPDGATALFYVTVAVIVACWTLVVLSRRK